MLGPNGAGKTTAVKILTTLITADQGRASVAGCDVADDPRGVRRRIGVSGQYAAVDEYLTGFENLEMIGRLYHLGRRESAARASSCWRSFGSRMLPTARRRRTPAACSDGSTSPVPSGASTRAVPRRADHGPRSTQPHGDVEPVAGTCLGWHHPAAHQQYLEEADLLADNIIVIDNGKVIAEGTADDLKSQVGGERLEITVGDDAHVGAAVELLGPLAAGELTVDEGRRSLVVPVSGGAAVLADALRRLDAAGVGWTTSDSADPGRRLPDAHRSHGRGEVRARGGPPMSAATTVSDALVVAKRNLIKIKRVPDLLVFTTMSPIMFILLFAYVFGGAIDQQGGGAAYREFLIAGIFAQTVVFGATITGYGLAEDVKKGIIDRFRSLPMSPSAVLAGRTFSDVVNNVITLFVMSLTGLLVGWRIREGVLQALWAYVLLLVFAYAISWIMAWIGMLVPSPRWSTTPRSW